MAVDSNSTLNKNHLYFEELRIKGVIPTLSAQNWVEELWSYIPPKIIGMGEGVGLGLELPVTVIVAGELLTDPLDAVILAVPALTAETNPVWSTVATAVLSEAHVTVAVKGLPPWSNVSAFSCRVLPVCMVADCGDTVILESVAGGGLEVLTVIAEAGLFTDPLEAVISAVPVAIAETNPVWSTVATAVLFEAHVNVASSLVPDWSNPWAVSFLVWPTCTYADCGDTVILESTGVGGGLVTVIVEAGLTIEPLDAVILAVPALTAETNPAWSTVATAVLFEVHVTVVLKGLPAWSNVWGVNCCVWPTCRLADAGETVMLDNTAA